MKTLLITLLLLQTVFPPGKPPRRVFPPGGDGQLAGATCPLDETYFAAKYWEGCADNNFVVCNPKPEWAIAWFCWGGWGGANLGSTTINFTTHQLLEEHKNQAGEFVIDTYSLTTGQEDACYAILEPHCPA